MPSKVEIRDDRRLRFASLYLLHHMVRERAVFPVYLERNDSDLEPILLHLLAHDCVRIVDSARYEPSLHGREGLQSFMERYAEFLQIFDIYCAVDLAEGAFAFERYFELSPREWQALLAEDRFEDLRVAAAEYKGIDPVEVVFMSFLHEGRFGRDQTGWQFDLLLGSVWDEVAEIVETALGVDDLAYDGPDGVVSGEAVIRDVLTQGAQLLTDLLREEEARGGGRRDAAWPGSPLRATDYEAYYDPAYASPCWKTPQIL